MDIFTTKIITNIYPVYNHFHNILRLFDVLLNFPFATSEAMRGYLRKLENIRKVPKRYRMIA